MTPHSMRGSGNWSRPFDPGQEEPPPGGCRAGASLDGDAEFRRASRGSATGHQRPAQNNPTTFPVSGSTSMRR